LTSCGLEVLQWTHGFGSIDRGHCQATGFSLEEIGQILDDSSGHWKPLISAKVVELQRSRDELDRMIAMLEEVGRCGCSVVATCDRMPPLTRER
jgi:DNA-binding transcriptional MerR regulator